MIMLSLFSFQCMNAREAGSLAFGKSEVSEGDICGCINLYHLLN